MLTCHRNVIVGSLVILLFSVIVASVIHIHYNYAAAQNDRFVNSLGMEFVAIFPKSFVMGSPSLEPNRRSDEITHRVNLTKPFFIQVTEVTQGQWKALMKSNPAFFDSCGDNCPVYRVSWFDCQDFIRKLNELDEGTYRLPTEAEWEFACRAGTQTPYSWGNEIDCSRAMFENNTLRGEDECVRTVLARGLKPNSPAPVKSYPPNPWGLYDFSGNVWEWCQDWYGPYMEKDVVDPTGHPSGDYRVRRGGSWFKYGHYCRCANRNFADPADRYSTTGFRVVRDYP